MHIATNLGWLTKDLKYEITSERIKGRFLGIVVDRKETRNEKKTS